MNKEIKEEFIEALGALPFKTDVRDYKLKAPVTAEEFPEEFELEPPAIKNQGSVGACVAHSIAEAVEYHNRIQEGNNTLMSTGFIYGNRRNSLNKDAGMYVREALANTAKYGDTYKSDFSENVEVPKAITLFEDRFDSLKGKAYPNRISTYFRVTSDEDIKRALMKYGPVVFAMNWYKNTKVDANGIMQVDTSSGVSGGHCMLIYGWNKDGWKIQNSWGVTWGKSGRAILPYDVKKSEAWGVTDTIVGEKEDIVVPDFNSVLGKIIAKILNFIINLFKKK